MSIYSEYKLGIVTRDELSAYCRREQKMDEWLEAQELLEAEEEDEEDDD